MRTLKKTLRGALKLVLVVGIGVGVWYGYRYYYAAEEDDGIEELPTVVAEIRDIIVSVSATGVLEPVRVVDVKSKASGEILEMPVEMGDYAEQGDLVLQVDTRIVEQELRQMDADLQSAEVRAEIAERQYERAQLLRAEDLISDNDLESSEQNAKNAESQLLRAQAAVELANERLQDATVRAPISGTIIAKQVEEGTIITSSTSNVSGGTTLVQMADLSELEVRTLVDEIDIGQVRPGLPVEMTVEAFPEREFRGQVMKIEPQAVIEQSVTTFPVLSRVDNSDGVLLPGMNAEVHIIIHRRPGVLAVPNEAVRTPDDARQVAELLGLAPAGGAADNGEGFTRTAEAGGGAPGGVAGGATTARDADRAGRNGRGGGDRAAGARAPGEGGSRGSGTGGFPGGGRRGGFDPNDPEVARRMEELLRRRAEESGPDDPWGIDEPRREPAVVFMQTPEGGIVARDIVVGVRDWEYTEVISGLQAGDRLVVLPSTSLLRSQEEMRERFSRRGMMPGLGGGRGRR